MVTPLGWSDRVLATPESGLQIAIHEIDFLQPAKALADVLRPQIADAVDGFELAEVVRNLAIREADKGLSTGEKQMYTRAKKILASELMYALDMEEGESEDHLDSLIQEAHAERNGAPA